MNRWRKRHIPCWCYLRLNDRRESTADLERSIAIDCDAISERLRLRDSLVERDSHNHLCRLWRCISDSWFHPEGCSCWFELDSRGHQVCRALCYRYCSQHVKISVADIEESDQDLSVYRTSYAFYLEMSPRWIDSLLGQILPLFVRPSVHNNQFEPVKISSVGCSRICSKSSCCVHSWLNMRVT